MSLQSSGNCSRVLDKSLSVKEAMAHQFWNNFWSIQVSEKKSIPLGQKQEIRWPKTCELHMPGAVM